MDLLAPSLTRNTATAFDETLAGWRAIHEMGQLAREAGETAADCPRAPFTMAALVWLAGFSGSSFVLGQGLKPTERWCHLDPSIVAGPG
jgi:hypothetical protein